MSQSSEFHSPTRHHQRRLSRRSSSQSKSFLDLPGFNSPRTPCPRDTNAFSYNPAHLDAWRMDDTLWNALPSKLWKPLADMQHAGAAVLTGFERIRDLYNELDGVVEEDHDSDDEDLFVSSPGSRRVSSAEFAHGTFDFSSLLHAPARTPSLTSLPSLPESRNGSVYGETNGGHSPGTHPQTPFDPPVSPLFLPLGSMLDIAKAHSVAVSSGPGTPLCPSPRASLNFRRTSSFQRPPHNPRIAQWRAEVSYMRETSLVNLRHTVRTVQGAWNALRLREEPQSDNGYDTPPRDTRSAEDIEAWDYMVGQFESWFAEKKAAADEVIVKGKLLGMNVNLGWGERGMPEERGRK